MSVLLVSIPEGQHMQPGDGHVRADGSWCSKRGAIVGGDMRPVRCPSRDELLHDADAIADLGYGETANMLRQLADLVQEVTQ